MSGLFVEHSNKMDMEMTSSEINLAFMAFAIGQTHPNDSALICAESIVDYAKRFTEWEQQNVLSLKDGWETYMENGGEDFESVIYEWAKEFSI